MSWTKEKIDKLKKLWKKGMTTVEIGKALGISKNAVVGKAHRLQLDARPSPIKRSSDKKLDVVVDNNNSKVIVHSKSNNENINQNLNEKNDLKQTEVVEHNQSLEKSIQSNKINKQNKNQKENMPSLMDVTATSCRWPIGDPKDNDFHFCDKEAVEGKPYCLLHCAQAYVGVNKFLKNLKSSS